MFRIIPNTIGFLLMKLTSVKIRFGSIAWSKAKNVQVLYCGYEIHVEEIALKSNFFNSDISNPIQIFIRDVRINKNIEPKENNDPNKLKPNEIQSNEPVKAPSFLVTLFQVCILSCYLIFYGLLYRYHILKL